MNTRIIISFILTIVLLISLSVFSIYKMLELSKLTEEMYNHPYRVSNTTKNIQSHIISMHRYMKDVSLATTPKALELAISRVNEDELEVYHDYATVFKFYLGERSDIETSYRSFTNWKVIRDEIVFLTKHGKNSEAQDLTQTKGYEHVLLLNKQIDTLVQYANNKADLFLNNAKKTKKEAITFTIGLLFLTAVLVILIMFLLMKKISSMEKDKEDTILLLHKAQAAAKIGTWEYHIKEDDLTWNDETYKIFERSSFDKVNNLKDFYDGVHPDDLMMVTKAYAKHLKTHEPFNLVHRIITVRGEVKYVDQKCQTKFNSKGNPIVSNGVITDVTNNTTEKIDLNQKLVHDTLTNAYNRFFFEKNIDIIIKDLDPTKHLAVIMIDIDFFKKVNDEHGHDVGDSVLKELVVSINESIRDNDYLIRWGGEEFVLLMYTNDIESTVNTLTNIRQNINIKDFTTIENITCSFGATLYNKDENIEDTITRADMALYTAKENGRDQIQAI